MPSINPDFRNKQSNPKTDHAGPNQSQQRTNPDFNNRTTAEQFAKEKPEAKSEDKKSNLFKYGAIGAGITATLYLLKKKFLALVAAAATAAFVYFNQTAQATNSTKPQSSQTHNTSSQTEQVKQPHPDQINLDRIQEYISASKVEGNDKIFLDKLISSLKKKLVTHSEINKEMIIETMKELGFEENKQGYKKKISILMHPDKIKHSNISDLTDITVMIFQAANHKPKEN
ncbi:MAG: hypothetical protein O3C63_09505 [Cyanobacteria bacterium]|nr:hypothetical protein [Cyanobacteriota bacterium]MDA1021674.1 hypothetical protein [Cyanobacteriota bacterium]